MPFETRAGVRQGGPESPAYFCILMDWIMRLYEERAQAIGLHGVRLRYNIPAAATSREERSEHRSSGSLNLQWCAFADDIMLTYESADDLKRGLALLVEIFDEYDLHISEKRQKH